MSVQTLYSQISSVDKEIVNLKEQVNSIEKRIIAKSREANTYIEKISREKDIKKVVALQKDLHRKQEEVQRIEKEKIGKEKMLNDKRRKRGDLQVQVLKAEKVEREKIKKENDELLQMRERVSREMRRRTMHFPDIISTTFTSKPMQNQKQFDVFVSHASEDKDEFVDPLVRILESMGVEVWYDKKEIKLGYSIRKSIDNGLANSKFGVVVLSKIYITKYWTEQELNGLFAKNLNNSILPIWHKITRDEIAGFSQMLLDIKGLNTALFSIEEIAKEIVSVVKPRQNHSDVDNTGSET